jgi:hypothetical protein
MNIADENASKFISDSEKSNDLSGHRHRRLIGIIGLVLPFLLWLLDGWRFTEGLHRWHPLSSISAYYYTGAVSALSGALAALAVFLFAYRGYNNEYRRYDRWAAIIAGIAAILVAFFPTRVPTDFSSPSWWTEQIGRIHYFAAVVLFSSFIFFCLVQFPRSDLKKGELPWDKQARNYFYIFCGLAITACMVWAALALRNNAPIFWPETLALEFFAFSWLVKGRVDKPIANVGRQALHYGKHPRQLVNDVGRAMRVSKRKQAGTS